MANCGACLHLEEDAERDDVIDFIVETMLKYKVTSSQVIEAFIKARERERMGKLI